MTDATYVPADEIRARFSRAMSRMYRQEVPAYGTLVDLVAQANAEALDRDLSLARSLKDTGSLERISEERHGAIRVGTATELAMLRRLFAVMGMFPVGYYDLSVAGLPVHSTAFRPVTDAALKRNPFRVFTSLLRLDLVSDPRLRADTGAALAGRDVFSHAVRALVDQAERDGGLAEPDAECFVCEALETFRWHEKALVSKELYDRLHQAHRLVADAVSFKGPHINHLTPRTLDIDRVQELMPANGISPKESIEGPPQRQCPILLRQTSFKALQEPVAFRSEAGAWLTGTHTARFGEVEQRGIALTPKGRVLYDRLLAEAQGRRRGDGTCEAGTVLAETFASFPDDYAEMRAQGLAYFEYVAAGPGRCVERASTASIEDLVQLGQVIVHPIVYEDFLPVSAAGIFRSNLGGSEADAFASGPNRQAFEDALGAPVRDEFALYAAVEQASIRRCLDAAQTPAEAA